MKATNLRIGNFIREIDPNNNKPFQVWGIYDEKGNSKINYFPKEIFEPIPLTREWLLKFGFTKFNNEYRLGFYKNLELSPTIKWLAWFKNRLYFKDDEFEEIFFLELKYVHQLQNLYFALTNKELKIK